MSFIIYEITYRRVSCTCMQVPMQIKNRGAPLDIVAEHRHRVSPGLNSAPGTPASVRSAAPTSPLAATPALTPVGLFILVVTLRVSFPSHSLYLVKRRMISVPSTPNHHNESFEARGDRAFDEILDVIELAAPPRAARREDPRPISERSGHSIHEDGSFEPVDGDIIDLDHPLEHRYSPTEQLDDIEDDHKSAIDRIKMPANAADNRHSIRSNEAQRYSNPIADNRVSTHTAVSDDWRSSLHFHGQRSNGAKRSDPGAVRNSAHPPSIYVTQDDDDEDGEDDDDFDINHIPPSKQTSVTDAPKLPPLPRQASINDAEPKSGQRFIFTELYH